MSNQIEPGEGYRLLQIGETRIKGDEFFSLSAWSKVRLPYEYVIDGACCPHRRKIEPAAPTSDPVNHPAHYNAGRIEVIDAIEDWKLGYNLGCVVKYIGRCEHKGAPIEDLKKAAWYLAREIKRMEDRE